MTPSEEKFFQRKKEDAPIQMNRGDLSSKYFIGP